MAYQEPKKPFSPLPHPPPPHRRPGPPARVVSRDRLPTAIEARVVRRPESSPGPSRPPARVVRRPESSAGPSRPPARVVRRPESPTGPSPPPDSAGPSDGPPARVVRQPLACTQPDRRHWPTGLVCAWRQGGLDLSTGVTVTHPNNPSAGAFPTASTSSHFVFSLYLGFLISLGSSAGCFLPSLKAVQPSPPSQRASWTRRLNAHICKILLTGTTRHGRGASAT